MAEIEWRLQGVQFDACNCNWGCPCQFNALPTHGNCEAVVAMRIEQGQFDQVNLDGLCWVATFAWPGAIHQGNGRCQAFVDERATQQQREALLTILSGQESDPGMTVFQVFSGTISEMLEPQFVPIEFSADVAKRTARVVVPGVLESTGEPILNPITGQAHQARLTLPGGFEYHEAEMASASYATSGAIKISSQGSNGMLMNINTGRHGVVH